MNNIGNDLTWLYNGGMTPFYDSTLSGSAASFDITGIPATWAHLKLEVYLREDAVVATDVLSLRFNNDSGANYDYQFIQGSATTAGAGTGAGTTSIRCGQFVSGASAPANAFGAAEITVPHYAGSANHKSVTAGGGSRSGATAQIYEATFGSWRNTAAITRITLLPGAGNFVSGSRVTLYGLGVAS